ncbi:hypothetical protein [Lentzea sp. NPDC004782]|uniref:hypothetical protein n=1 Tax=Lentzea sp. NPDC004782 TaxID=3154458 RepID=UPI0033A0A322
MPEQLEPPPVLDRPAVSVDLSEADVRFRQWMHENLSHAADHFGLTVTDAPRLGRLDRSISAPVLAATGRRLWLRVVSEGKQWTGGEFWTGNLDATVFTTLSKPRVLDVYEWEEWRQQRAELSRRRRPTGSTPIRPWSPAASSSSSGTRRIPWYATGKPCTATCTGRT